MSELKSIQPWGQFTGMSELKSIQPWGSICRNGLSHIGGQFAGMSELKSIQPWGSICRNGLSHIGGQFAGLGGQFKTEHSLRFKSYDIELNPVTDCTFAPSVADSWQGEGLGGTMFSVIRHNLLTNGFQRVVLWGGVQADNLEALAFYEAQGFVRMGEFSRNGSNWDMMLTL